MTYQTNNPVGSVDVRDLYDNAEAFDNFSAGPLDAYPDRFGVSRQSLQGIRNASQYVDLGPYAAGLVFTSRNQVFSYLGEFYAPGPGLALPYTTDGSGAPEIALFRSVGDAILRSDLADEANPPLGAALVGRAGQVVSSIVGLRALVKTAASKNALVTGYYAAGDGGGGPYYLDESDVISADNGGTVIVATDGGRWKLVHSGVISIKQFGCKADGVTDNTARWQAASDYVATIAGELYSPAGIYAFASSIIGKNGVRYTGAGVDITLGGTKYVFTGTSDFFKIQNPINNSTSANIEIEGIWFFSTSITLNNGLLFDTGSSVVVVRRCRFNSSGCGIILDQSELFDIEYCSFNATVSGACGIWLVNGADKNVGASPYFTNRIGVHASEFNGAAGAVAIYDDGGTAHTFENLNMNACGSHILATGVNGLKITGGEFEISSAQSIVFGLVKRLLGAGAKSPAVSVCDTFLYNNIVQPVIASVAGAIGQLRLENNVINTVSLPFSGLDVACDRIEARGNTQVGPASGVGINNHIDVRVAATAWSATGSVPSLGNGTLTASISRRGKLVTMRLQLTIGSTTTFGTGDWLFDLPFAGDTSAFSQTGACRLTIAGTSHYSATVVVNPGATQASVYHNNANKVSGTVPTAWTTGSVLEFQLEYITAAPI